MSKFVSNKLKQVDLGNGEWVKIPTEIAFGDLESFVGSDLQDFSNALAMVVYFIKEWNLKNEAGEDVELTEENIKMLKMEEMQKIQKGIVEIMPKVDKKKLEKESAVSQKQ